MADIHSADRTRLRLHEQGPEDAPVVVLVHGLGLSARSWGRLPEALSEDHRVVAYDLRGHADSGAAAGGDYTLAAHAADLAAVLDHALPNGGQAVVVGNSLGGGIILEHARRSGTGRLAAVVFAGSGGSGVTLPGFPARGVPEAVEQALSRWYLQGLRATAVVGKRLRPVEALSNRLVRHFAFPPDAPEEVVSRVREDFFATRRRALARTTLASMRNDGLQYAEHLDVPTLVLHGTGDPEVPEDEARELVQRLPDAELYDVPGAGHMLALTHPELVVDQVRRWIDEHAASARP